MSTNPIEPTFDKDGYPTDEWLDSLPDYTGTPADLVATLAEVFQPYGDVHWGHCDSWKVGHPGQVNDQGEREPDVPTESTQRVEVRIVTGGWSGNESIVSALRDTAFWFFYWESSVRGGAFTFEVPADHWNKPLISMPFLVNARRRGLPDPHIEYAIEVTWRDWKAAGAKGPTSLYGPFENETGRDSFHDAQRRDSDVTATRVLTRRAAYTGWEPQGEPVTVTAEEREHLFRALFERYDK